MSTGVAEMDDAAGSGDDALKCVGKDEDGWGDDGSRESDVDDCRLALRLRVERGCGCGLYDGGGWGCDLEGDGIDGTLGVGGEDNDAFCCVCGAEWGEERTDWDDKGDATSGLWSKNFEESSDGT